MKLRLRFVELRGDPKLEDRQVVLAGEFLGDAIRVGDRFSTLVDRAGAVVVVDLAVLDIGFYGTAVLELEPAMAGELVLVGDVSGLPIEGAILRGTGFDWPCEEDE